MTSVQPKRSNELFWFMTSCALVHTSASVQGVIFPYLVTVVLQQSAENLSTAATVAALPPLLLSLSAGAIGDRVDGRAMLTWCYVAQFATYAIFAGLLYAGALSFAAVVAAGAMLGLVTAFAAPTRGRLLNLVAGDRIQKGVSFYLGLQFCSYMVGLVAGGATSKVGAPVLVTAQAGLLLASLFAIRRLAPKPPQRSDDAPRTSQWSEIKEALVLVYKSPRLLPPLVFIGLTALVGVGPAIIGIPLLTRDVYHGDSKMMAICFGGFVVGSAAASFLLGMLPPIKRQGQFMFLAQGMKTLVFIGMTQHPPLVALYLLMLAWGVSNGLGDTVARSVIQESASKTQIAKVMSVLELVSLGVTPISTKLMGYNFSALGPVNAYWVTAGISILAILSTHLLTPLSKIMALEPPKPQDAHG